MKNMRRHQIAKYHFSIISQSEFVRWGEVSLQIASEMLMLELCSEIILEKTQFNSQFDISAEQHLFSGRNGTRN
jgi:hypothetical protein